MPASIRIDCPSCAQKVYQYKKPHAKAWGFPFSICFTAAYFNAYDGVASSVFAGVSISVTG